MGRYRKTIVAVLGIAVQIAQSGLLPLTLQQHAWVTAVVAALTALGVYSVRNAPPKVPDVVQQIRRRQGQA